MTLRRLAVGAVLTAPLILASWNSARAESVALSNPVAIITVPSRASLIHLGSLDSFDITAGGTRAARGVLDYLEKGDRRAARMAVNTYENIIPDENFGGEYTALQWLMECQLASDEERNGKFLADPLVRSFYDLLAKNNWTGLREFLRDKYHLDETPGQAKDRNLQRRARFMEDFLLFNNPRRESWEKSSAMIAALKLKPGDQIADIGSGPGYFTFAFSKRVGESGKVFAIDNNEDHLIYLREAIQRLGYKNIEPVMPSEGEIGITDKVDLVYMCSLYHNLYAIMSDEERGGFIDRIKEVLKENGRWVLVDNGPVTGTLPYHGPYISRELIIHQLAHHGFELTETQQFIPQRYMLFFKLRRSAGGAATAEAAAEPAVLPKQGLVIRSLPELPPTPGVARFVDGDPNRIEIASQRSLVRTLITGTSPTYSTGGRLAAEVLLDALNTKDRSKLIAARKAYEALIPHERIGDEYPALQWFIDYLLAPEAEKAAFLTNNVVSDYFDFFAGNDFKRLRTYLKNKYVLAELKPKLAELEKKNKKIPKGDPEKIKASTPPPPYHDLPLEVELQTLIDWWEYMAYSNPRREEWEKTGQVLDFLDLKRGDRVADIGSGAGYYTFRFATRVGREGKVYAVDMAKEPLANLSRAAVKAGLSNIETVVSKEDDATLPENSIDMAYLCSLYHATYVTSMEYVKDRFVASLRKALKPGGRLVIVDNQPMPSEAASYYGPRIAKELVIAQLQQYGFRFSAFAQFVPQRYVLVFDVNKPEAR